MKKKNRTYSYLPDHCWESIFKFILNDDDNRSLKSLSLVSKQFLSVTNSLVCSLTVEDATDPFLSCLLKQFINLSSLHLIYSFDIDNILDLISRFPLKKLTSLAIYSNHTFPANGLRAFSQNITTLTSLTCYSMFLYNNDLLLIADCFPLLKELNLIHPLLRSQTNLINGIHSLSSKCQCIRHLNLRSTYFLNDQHVARLSLFLGDLVSINLNDCSRLSESALFSLVRNCPSVSDIKMENTTVGKQSVEHSGVYPQLKSLYLGKNDWLCDEKIIMLASFFPNLELLDLNTCKYISNNICQVFRRCGEITHLNLSGSSRVKLLGINFVVPKLEMLNLSNTKVEDETLYVISKNCCGLLKLLMKNCRKVTKKGVKHVVENCTQLREISLDDLHLSEINTMLKRILLASWMPSLLVL